METGGHDLPLDYLKSAIAVSFENSLYVAKAALSDPNCKDLHTNPTVKRITGNIGRSGLSILVSPSTPRLSHAPGEDWSAILHDSYDLRRIDCFSGTSLHLWFTGWSNPIVAHDGRRTIDTDFSIVESVITVRDSGKDVADLDILRAGKNLTMLPEPTDCTHTSAEFEAFKCVSLDSWDELFETPEQEKRMTRVGIFRAYGNWPARLAAACVPVQLGRQNTLRMITSDHKCMKCIEESMSPEPDCPIVLID
ncbi:MAG: hypothetical protein M1831_006565 [Alyxoria varia]|nr:MAG: hypothetical protein M1831_006565 [Alyxoria varia]